MIYVDLKGRIGNQLFIYAYAEALRKKRNRNEKIVFLDYPVLNQKWVNSLKYYNLENVEFIHDNSYPLHVKMKRYLLRKMYSLADAGDYLKIARIENKFKPLLTFLGVISCENGYIDVANNNRRNLYVSGYFQCPKFFACIDQELIDKFRLQSEIEKLCDVDVNKIKESNSVCISIKVEHNVGNSMYDVCSREYWEKAINYIVNNVENPLFFICSDNVQYVREHFIDTAKYNTICQNSNLPVHVSLAIMGLCKHFIIGNTSYGWWAQHISLYKNKIVVAPSRWYNVEMPVDIYESNWYLIKV